MSRHAADVAAAGEACWVGTGPSASPQWLFVGAVGLLLAAAAAAAGLHGILTALTTVLTIMWQRALTGSEHACCYRSEVHRACMLLGSGGLWAVKLRQIHCNVVLYGWRTEVEAKSRLGLSAIEGAQDTG